MFAKTMSSAGHGRRARSRDRETAPHARRAALRPLPDILAPGLRAVFVGINPSIASGVVGHHFAGPGNPFWRLLHASGFTPVLLTPAEDARLLEFGLGLTNLCPRPTRSAAELTRSEYVAGAHALVRTLEMSLPSVVVLVGVSLARIVLPRGQEAGAGPRAASIGGARVYVLPNPSGRNAAYPSFESKLAWFVRLKELVRPRSGRVSESVGCDVPPAPGRPPGGSRR